MAKGMLHKKENETSPNDPDKHVEVKTKSLSREEVGFTDSQEDLIPTFDVNMRLDNHTRNAVLALAKASADKRTASEMVSILVENYLKDSSERTKEIYNDLLNMYEERDKLSYKLKTKK